LGLVRPPGLSGSSSSYESVGGLSSDRPAALLTDLHRDGTLMHMRTTLNIDDRLLTEARRLSGLKVKTAVLHAGLEALIARESAKRLATLGGHERRLKPIPRRRAARRG
jgi:Arc/MetJ family transcription regulator